MTEFKALLAQRLQETEGRSVYPVEEVRDMLLDFWLAIEADTSATPIEPELAIV